MLRREGSSISAYIEGEDDSPPCGSRTSLLSSHVSPPREPARETFSHIATLSQHPPMNTMPMASLALGHDCARCELVPVACPPQRPHPIFLVRPHFAPVWKATSAKVYRRCV
jgi:hypothetical protein